ncbi:protein of unknown function [Butyrivibrio sp. ob235]|uniref:BREX protein BrxB domain-containing protein n=1 Tax=Butyrivibrio sp. ob235 TaxID=1761780 RepID=UPI0008CC8736|nr:BREX protein BrxB domain-containing protein [Butyrivibrio sp. ob235]SEM42615.1 protein of unknown function [Butyrivibrio sp. ob235]
MSRIQTLVNNYQKFIDLPWRDVSSEQRIIFCVYEPTEEMTLRYNIPAFKLATEDTGHRWMEYDLTTCFEDWMGKQKYAEAYFAEPEKLLQMPRKFEDYIEESFKEKTADADKNTMIGIVGVGSIFGFITVKEFIEKLADDVDSRIVLFFPGTYSSSPTSNYRFLNAYDNWSYLATPITADVNNF